MISEPVYPYLRIIDSYANRNQHESIIYRREAQYLNIPKFRHSSSILISSPLKTHAASHSIFVISGSNWRVPSTTQRRISKKRWRLEGGERTHGPRGYSRASQNMVPRDSYRLYGIVWSPHTGAPCNRPHENQSEETRGDSVPDEAFFVASFVESPKDPMVRNWGCSVEYVMTNYKVFKLFI